MLITRPKQAPSAPTRPGKPSVRTAKFVTRKDLDENRPLRRKAVALDELLVGLVGERQRVRLEDLGFLWRKLEDEIVVRDDDELVDRVEQVEQVLGDPATAVEVE
jgi:hypothetical protein